MDVALAVTSTLQELLFNKLIDDFKGINSADQALTSLETVILEAKRQLESVGQLQLRGHDMRALQIQVNILTGYYYDAEDLKDKLALKATKPNSVSGGRMIKKIRHFWRNITTPDKINELQTSLEEITKQLNILSESYQPNSTILPYDGSIPILSNSLIRRNVDKSIIHKLISGDGSRGISIIGMCGLGKSVLARTILAHKEIVDRFSTILWIPVPNGVFDWRQTSQEFADGRYLLNKEAVEDARAHESPSSKKQQENWLIVFDNLLDLKSSLDWDSFWTYILPGKNAVKVIITTRNARIFEETSTTPYYLEPLSEDGCKKLIELKAKSYDKVLSDRCLVSLAKKCEGLPLIARWLGIAVGTCGNCEILEKAELCDMPKFQKEILPIFVTSYKDLGLELQKCLAYFSLFPVSHHFDIADLVNLWVGEGFIQLQPFEATSSLEQIGEEYVGHLAERSILQSCGPNTKYKLHSFAQVFAKWLASGTCLQFDQGVPSKTPANDKIRHLSLPCRDHFKSESWSELIKFRKLRTFLSLYDESNIGQIGQIPRKLHKAVSRLRVLSLKGTNVDDLPTFIHKLIHLRYLDISFTRVAKLPKTFYKLRALQFFKLNGAEKLSHFPEQFHKLTNLRYVDWEEGHIRKLRLPAYIGTLSSLENLPLFEVGDKEGYSIKELKDMNNLRESICIENLQIVANTAEAEEAMLKQKSGLRKIKLQWKTHSSRRDCTRDEDILMGLEPHKNVRELKITNYGGDKLPEWIIKSTTLEKIHLFGCRSCCLFPELRKMKHLKTIVIEEIESMTCISCYSNDDSDVPECFPSLESMEFHNMPELQEWRGLQANDMPRLRKIKFVDCPKIDSLVPSVSELITSLTSLVVEDTELKKSKDLQ